MNRMLTIAATELAAVALTVTALVTTPARASNAGLTRCYGYLTGVTNGRESLLYWAARRNSDITRVVITTWKCDGNALDPAFIRYLNGGKDSRPMPAGIRLWAIARPPGCHALVACPGKWITNLGR